MNKFIKRLQILLEEKDFTQKELANKVGVTEVTISRYMNGERKPRIEIINKIAETLDTTTDYLLGRTDIKTPYTKENIFIKESKEKYGSRGKKQAEELLDNVRSMFDGGELPDEDKDEFFKAMTDIYFDSKEKNKKYTPKKYRKGKNNE